MSERVESQHRTRKLVSDSILTTGTDIAAAVLAVLNGLILARALGPELRGVFAIVVLVPVVLHRFGLLGYGAGMVHGIATDPESMHRRAANAVFFSAMVAVTACTAGFWFYGTGVVPELGLLSSTTVTLALIGLAGLVFNTCARSVMVGQDQLGRRNQLRIVTPAVRLVAFLVLLVALNLGVAGAVAGWAIAITAETLLGLSLVLPLVKAGGWRPDFGLLGKDLRFGLQVYLTGIAMILLFRLDQFLVSHFMDSTAVGHYAVAVNLMGEMGVLPMAVQAAFLPKITRRFSEIGSKEKMTPAVCRVLLLTMTALALVSALVAYPGIRVLYGTDFTPSVWAFLLLLPSTPLLALLVVLNAALRARGRPILTSVAAGTALVANILLDLVLIPAWGINGAAVASTLAYLLGWSILAALYLRIEPSVRLADLVVPRGEDIRRIRQVLREIVSKARGRARS